MAKWPKIDDENFNEKITTKFAKFEIPHVKKSFRSICFPQEYKHQIPQLFLSEFINPKTPYRGVLVYHRIGAGKTCASIGIAEHFIDAQYQVIIVLPASLRTNYRDELRSQCVKEMYITKEERQKLSEMLPSDPRYREIIRASDKRIDSYYNIYSYNKFFDIIDEIDLEKTLLIIDEVQNIVSETGTYYEQIMAKLKKTPDSLRTVIMTATPIFDKPVEIALTMNLILPKEKRLPIGHKFNDKFIHEEEHKDGSVTHTAINMDEFKETLKGYVSYYRGAPESAFPQAIFKVLKCVMVGKQLTAYEKAINNEKKIYNEGEEITNSFFILSRIISNFIFSNMKLKEDGFRSLRDQDFDPDNLRQLSAKLWKLIGKIKKLSGLHFVYSAFKGYGGLEIIAKMLDHYGYKNYFLHGPGPKRYVFWTGDQTDAEKDEIKAVFNHASNENGSRLKIILGSPSIKEGVSLLRLHVVHLFEPYWNMSRLEQIMGRGIRYCSHKDLPEERRFVMVFLYLATNPEIAETIDQKILKMAFDKTNIRTQFELALKECAVDCQLNHYGNKTIGEKIQCDV